ncbi:nuclear transport factor 2 family protein [Flavobacterium sp.]|uniref:nuclear transport factor 2 family protein n=1 Tax=Flavobacterium sp. TaxID=239 RepID=UPI002613CE03|nr:nuclear transport factor 2 family protein [Flavobacterium sp.]
MKLWKILLLCVSCAIGQTNDSPKQKVDAVLNQWHEAAATANWKQYEALMGADFHFIGTDATENWDRQAFADFAKPYFDRGKGWKYTPLERNIYFNKQKNMAWFDELLDSNLGVCRGSGILILTKGKWLFSQYVLSMTVPNDHADTVVKLKQDDDSLFKTKLNKAPVNPK